MLHYEATREVIDEIMSSPGEVRGVVLKTDKSFVLSKGGKVKLREVEKELEEMGHPFSYENIKNMDYYPWGRRVLSLLAISRVFNMDKEGIRKIGRDAPKKSFLIKLFMRYFLSPEKTFQKVSHMWRQHHTIGRIEVVEADNKEKKAVIRLYNLNFHPIFCDYLSGYFEGIARMVEQSKINCKEEKCFFKGESFYHEFSLKW